MLLYYVNGSKNREEKMDPEEDIAGSFGAVIFIIYSI